VIFAIKVRIFFSTDGPEELSSLERYLAVENLSTDCHSQEWYSVECLCSAQRYAEYCNPSACNL